MKTLKYEYLLTEDGEILWRGSDGLLQKAPEGLATIGEMVDVLCSDFGIYTTTKELARDESDLEYLETCRKVRERAKRTLRFITGVEGVKTKMNQQ